jgi:hypothetical protein
MHLDCIQSLAEKLTDMGVVCIDDTWLEAGHWTAKGTLAVPYLLAHGFELFEVRSGAVLLKRHYGGAQGGDDSTRLNECSIERGP